MLQKASGFFPQLIIEIKSWESVAGRKVLFAKDQLSRERQGKGKHLSRESQEVGVPGFEEGSWDFKHFLTPPCWAGAYR